ncbi:MULTISPECIES: DUF1007 family protein [Rhizobium]|uniref:DUF1007 family protein n=2 Tax=Rhizobium TaxID=379 RepID=UPI0024752202|nr:MULTISPECIES: DUF1007 family protein [Rhizobium]
MAAASIGIPTPAMAHPHIFVDAKFEAVGGADGNLSALRHIWRFDEVFSSSVLLDFDKNENMTLDPPELEAVAETVSASLSKYSYYTNITVDGKAVALGKPDAIKATYVDQSVTRWGHARVSRVSEQRDPDLKTISPWVFISH